MIVYSAEIVIAPPNTTGMTACGIRAPPLNIDSVRQSAPNAPSVPAANPHLETPPVKSNESFPTTFMASTFVPTSTMPLVIRTVAEWNPVTTLSDALRILFGNPNTPPALGDPWSIAHPIAYTLIWIAGIILVCAPLAVRAYERSLAK